MWRVIISFSFFLSTCSSRPLPPDLSLSIFHHHHLLVFLNLHPTLYRTSPRPPSCPCSSSSSPSDSRACVLFQKAQHLKHSLSKKFKRKVRVCVCVIFPHINPEIILKTYFTIFYIPLFLFIHNLWMSSTVSSG